jgi:hypothetical protein
MAYSGDGGKLIHAKNHKQKSRDTVLLKGALGEKTFLSITSKTIRGYYLKSVEIMYFLKKFCNYFLGDITTFCKLFSQTDEKLLNKLPLEIMFVVVFWFWLGNSMAHTKIVAVRATLVRFLFRKHKWICGTILSN